MVQCMHSEVFEMITVCPSVKYACDIYVVHCVPANKEIYGHKDNNHSSR